MAKLADPEALLSLLLTKLRMPPKPEMPWRTLVRKYCLFKLYFHNFNFRIGWQEDPRGLQYH